MAERSHSGRVRLLGKQVSTKVDREFESRPLRHDQFTASGGKKQLSAKVDREFESPPFRQLGKYII